MSDIEITSNADDAMRRLRAIPPAMMQAIVRALDLENALTVSWIQEQHLTAPGATAPLPPAEHRLRSLSDWLRRGLRASAARAEGNGITSSIGTNVKYAGVHEYGFDGMVTVSAHQRRMPVGATKVGKVMDNEGHLHHDKTGRFTKAASRTGQVREFQRHMRMPERAPIRTGIKERTENYRTAISAAILSTWQKGGAS
jgi:hypothetical protein